MSRSAATLRLVYALAFMAQVLVATVVAVIVRALAGGTPRPSEILAWVLVALAVMQLPFAALLSTRLGFIANRQGALARTLFTAIVLASTAWATALALATGQRGLSVYVLLSLVMLAYALGFLVVSRLASRASALPPQAPPGSGADGEAAPPSGGDQGDVAQPSSGAKGADAQPLSAVVPGVLEDVDHVERLGGP
ncbi:MAG TPA: hypothetical protein VFN03_08310 [Trueperaceae bacterium]|nr:hypothetical protein [Trueperaceae bacterium]